MVFTVFLLALFPSALLMGNVLAIPGTAFWFYPKNTEKCGMLSDPEFVAGLSSAEYGQGENCGRLVLVTYQGLSIAAEVTDECKRFICRNPGDITISNIAFEALTGDLEKRAVPIEWKYFA